MKKFLLACHGGTMPESAEAQATLSTKWQSWWSEVEPHVLDAGAPLGPSLIIDKSGRSDAGRDALTGYTIIQAESLEEAAKLGAGSPMIDHGAKIEVCQLMEMG